MLDRSNLRVGSDSATLKGAGEARGTDEGPVSVLSCDVEELLDGRVGRRPTYSILSVDVRRSGQLGSCERCGQLADLDLPQGRVAEVNEELVEDLGELPFEGGEAG